MINYHYYYYYYFIFYKYHFNNSFNLNYLKINKTIKRKFITKEKKSLLYYNYLSITQIVQNKECLIQ
jgi:hypothetical protein